MSNITTVTKNTNWTCPAGVTAISVYPSDSAGVPIYPSRVFTVVPNTTYSITIFSSTWLGNATANIAAFPTEFRWTGSGYLTISWVE